MQNLSSVSARATALAFCLIMSLSGTAQNGAFPPSQTSQISSDEYIDELDTLTILQLIDSLLLLDVTRQSMMSVHFGYTSEVSNAGRTLEVKQYGFSPGITYIHRSGMFADLTGYWNSQFDPNYDLTVLSVGYLGILSKRFSYSFSYDHSFFTDSDPDIDLPPWVIEMLLPPILNNTISTGLDVDFNFIEAGVDYSWLFNKETSHRLQFTINGDLKKSKVLFLDRISFRPAFSMLFGNQDIISVSFSQDLLADRRFPFVINEENQFGVMNYQLSAPVTLSKSKFQLVFEYNYNIPQSLPGEKFQYDNNSFFSIDLYYTFGIGPKKSIFE